MIKRNISLILILLIYGALAISVSFVSHLGAGPDETAHLVYVRELGEHHRMPQPSETVTYDPYSSVSHEADQPPLYYALTALPYFITTRLGGDADTGWHVARIFTSLLGMIWVFMLYKLAMEFFDGKRTWAVLAAACVGLLPLPVFMGGVVNNDILITLTSTVVLWLLFRSLRRDSLDRKTALWTGVMCGLAILSKAQGMILLPVVVIIGLVIARRRSDKSVIANIVVTLLIALIVSSVWFIRNRIMYGALIVQPLNQESWGWSVDSVYLVTDQLFKFFWTPFWIVDPYVNNEVYTRLLLAFCLLVFVGVLVHLHAASKGKRSSLVDYPYAWILLASPAILIYLSLLRQTLVVDRGLLQQGRLMLPAAGLLGIAVMTALETITNKPRLRAILSIGLVCVLVAANLVVLGMID